jgi:hypothetical protein
MVEIGLGISTYECALYSINTNKKVKNITKDLKILSAILERLEW